MCELIFPICVATLWAELHTHCSFINKSDLSEMDPVSRNLLDAFALVEIHQICQRVEQVWASDRVPVILHKSQRIAPTLMCTWSNIK